MNFPKILTGGRLRQRSLALGIAGTLLAASAFAADPAADDQEPGRRSLAMAADDAAVTTNVKARLVADADTKAHQIDVTTSNGIVQLNGFVDTEEARTEAERLARETSGVAEVRNNLEVRPSDRTLAAMSDDAILTAKVDAALLADQRTSALRIGVESRGGEVQLSCFADSREEKAAAEEVARSVEGVRDVRNAIDIR